MSGRDEKRSPLGSRIWDRARRGPKGRSRAAVAEPEDDSYRAYPTRQA